MKHTITYVLPAYWASYLINGDSSGLMMGEEKEIDAWIVRQREILNAISFWCAGVGDEFSSPRNDYDNLAGTVAEFTFLIE